MVCENGCFGSIKPCEYFQTDDIEYLIKGIEDGWIKVDQKTWKEYLKIKEKFKEVEA